MGEIEKLYQSILGRSGEAAGSSFWTKKFMEDGKVSDDERALFTQEAQKELDARKQPPITGGVNPKPGTVTTPVDPNVYTPETGGVYPKPPSPPPPRIQPPGPDKYTPETGGVYPKPGTVTTPVDPQVQPAAPPMSIQDLYGSMLGRAGDDGGMKYWTDKLMGDGNISAEEQAEFMKAAAPEMNAKSPPAPATFARGGKVGTGRIVAGLMNAYRKR